IRSSGERGRRVSPTTPWLALSRPFSFADPRFGGARSPSPTSWRLTWARYRSPRLRAHPLPRVVSPVRRSGPLMWFRAGSGMNASQVENWEVRECYQSIVDRAEPRVKGDGGPDPVPARVADDHAAGPGSR